MATSLQLPYCRAHGKEPEEEETYSAENIRRIARSLSGTVNANREDMLISSHGFVSTRVKKTQKLQCDLDQVLFSFGIIAAKSQTGRTCLNSFFHEMQFITSSLFLTVSVFLLVILVYEAIELCPLFGVFCRLLFVLFLLK